VVGCRLWKIVAAILENTKLHFVINNHAKRAFANGDVNTIITVLDSQSISPLY
jgi:hypothetical protein